jgi:spore coat protein U-like protein
MRRTSMIAAAFAAAALAVLLVPGSAEAQATSSFTVTATVGKACTVSAAPISIASYDPNNTVPTVGTTNVNVACTKGTSYTTFLSSANAWRLVNTVTPANFLTYGITQGATATAWTATSGWAGVAADRLPAPYLATASVGALQDVPAGSYLDTVTINVTY